MAMTVEECAEAYLMANRQARKATKQLNKASSQLLAAREESRLPFVIKRNGKYEKWTPGISSHGDWRWDRTRVTSAKTIEGVKHVYGEVKIEWQ